MSNASFTRDEVILALDVLYFSGEKHLSKNSPAIAELCTLLQELPIHPMKDRPENFRNTVGVSEQIYKFSNERKGIDHKTWKVGTIFHHIADEFSGHEETLHEIAACIRRNYAFLAGRSIGNSDFFNDFPEGALLGYLHRTIEMRDGAALPPAERCDLCQLIVDAIYQPGKSILQRHLTIPPTALDGRKKYTEQDFITVCPNCHAALHRYRPWLERENCADILT